MKLAKRLLPLIVLLAVLTGCGGKEPRQPSGIMDSPEHHYRAGMHYMDKEQPERALSEFEKALELDSRFAPALSGKGLALAALGKTEDGMDAIDDGQDEAQTPTQELQSLIARLRAYVEMAKQRRFSEEELIEETEDVFEDAEDVIDDNPRLNEPALYYYMGQAYMWGLELEKAEKMFDKVLRIGLGYKDQAKAKWELVQKVRRAAPETHMGRRIALVERISRADMAALLVEELGFDRFLSRTQSATDTSFRPPEEPTVATSNSMPRRSGPPMDVVDHPLSADIELVLSYGVRGLEPYPNGRFMPQQGLSKAEVAMTLEDIFVRAMNNPALATQFIGQASPFNDIRADHPYFNAAMLTTTRGLLSTSVRGGNFGPGDPVSGVDAVLAIKKLKSELSVF